MKRIMISSAHSGGGKTLVTCLLHHILKKRGIKSAGFKCGPDYIDPLFHRQVLGVSTSNLDSFLMKPEAIEHLFQRNMEGADIGIIEGVMGYYDGLGMSDEGSSYSISRITGTPVIIVADCKGTSRTIAAVLKGLKEFREDSRVAGVIFNRVSERVYAGLCDEAEALGIRPLGFIPGLAEADIPSRHLGLVLPEEVGDFSERLEVISGKARIDVDGILELAEAVDPAGGSGVGISGVGSSFLEPSGVRPKPLIAVAKDEAFCFYYEDNLRLLEELGAEIVRFSPMRDEKLPEGISGLILPGGYPELHLPKLSSNASMLGSVREAVMGGLPTIAECGGFMYLHRRIFDLKGTPYEMTGVIDGECRYTGKLQSFGYEELVMDRDNLLGSAGLRIRIHEFHRYVSDAESDGVTAVKNGACRKACVAGDTLFAGFPHFHFYSDISVAKRFLEGALCFTFSRQQQY